MLGFMLYHARWILDLYDMYARRMLEYIMISEWLGLLGWLMLCCMLRCMLVCVCVCELECNIECAFNRVKTQDTMRGS